LAYSEDFWKIFWRVRTSSLALKRERKPYCASFNFGSIILRQFYSRHSPDNFPVRPWRKMSW